MRTRSYLIAAALQALHHVHGSAAWDNVSGLLAERDGVEAPTRGENDDSCNVFQKQIPDPLGSDKMIWVMAFPDASVHQCADVCGDAVAKQIAEGKVGSTTCISNNGEIDWQPYYGEQQVFKTCN